MVNAKKEGSPTQRPAGRPQTDFHCEDFVDLDAEQMAEQH
jgi:hypothetical protein